MQNIIIGTAGHVDHGKTCLIKALSGIDTDRLKEEKKRGITIENGYAHLNNDLGLHIGIIDVPGHEKFVKNMLAGIGGIDIVLLVISLEEGIKPQTVEHFEIIKSLGIKKGIIVYTKLDSETKVDFNNLKSQVKDLVKNSFLENAKEIPVSSFTGQNIDLLKETIFSYAKEIVGRSENKELTRLPIDRVFTMEGFGTVVTGTLMEGKVDVGDELMLYPSQRLVKVRGIQSHNESVPAAFAGQRTAINLMNVKKEDIDRGEVLAAKDSILLSDIIDCKLTMFKSITKDLKNGQKVHFSYGSNQVEAQIRVISGDIKSTSYVQFKFDEAIPVKRGDKYIIRNITPSETCGGGTILNINSKKLNEDIDKVSFYSNLDSGDDKKVLLEIINIGSNDFPDINLLSKKFGESVGITKNFVENLASENIIVCNFKKNFIIGKKFYDGLIRYLKDVLTKFHNENKLATGISKENLKSLLFKRYNRIGDTGLDNLLIYLSENNIIKINKDLVSLSDFSVKLESSDTKEISEIEKRYKDAGFEPPSCDEVIAEFSKTNNKKGPSGEKQIIVNLARDGVLVKLTPEYYMHKDFYNKAVDTTVKYLNEHKTMMMKDLRDMLKTSRKFAIFLVDHMDKMHITKTVGDHRELYK